MLTVLWELRTASVRDLYGRVGAPAGLVYTTIAKVVDRLREKGLVDRRREGSAFVYVPAAERRAVERARARQLVSRFFGPAPRSAAAALVEAVGEIDPELLATLERAIRDKKRPEHGA